MTWRWAAIVLLAAPAAHATPREDDRTSYECGPETRRGDEDLVERSERELVSSVAAASARTAHLRVDERAWSIPALRPFAALGFAPLRDRTTKSNATFQTTSGPLVALALDGVVRARSIGVTARVNGDVSAVERRRPEGNEPVSIAAPSTSGARGHGLSPLVAYGGVGLTIGLLSATTFLALDTKHTHDAFVRAGCGSGAGGEPGCVETQDDGARRQTLTNLLLIATLLVGAATTVTAIVFTDWKAPRFARVSPSFGRF